MSRKSDDAEDGSHASTALKAGTIFGILGLAVGACIGLYRRPTHPKLYALSFGLKSGILGASFFSAREAVLNIRPFSNAPLREPPSRVDQNRAATVAGLGSGTIVGLLNRGYRGVPVAATVCGVMGYLGQMAYTTSHAGRIVRTRHDKERSSNESNESWIDRVANQKWTMLEKLDDEEYMELLEEKVIKIEAEIALIDGRIAALRHKSTEANANNVHSSADTTIRAAQQQP